MAEIKVTKEKLESIQQKLTQYLLDAGYEGTLEDGTGAYDIVIKGNALITMYLNDQFEKTRGYLSLEEAERFKDVLGSEYDDAIDSILSNWFVSRKSGTEARVELRLWFSRPPESLSFKEGDEIVEIDETPFKIARDYSFSSDDYVSTVRHQRFLEEFYIDIEVEAAEEGELDIDKSSDVDIDFSNTYYLRAEVNDIISYGDPEESSEDFIDRTENVITTRELITYKALDTVIKDEFREVNKLYVAGHGEKEQMRDVVEFQDVSVHVGNKADIYINGDHAYKTETLTADNEGYLKPSEDNITHIFNPINKETEIEVNFDVDVEAENDYLFTSNEVELKIKVDTSYADEEFEVSYLYSPTVSRVHDYVTGNQNRVVCYSPVVKSLFPVVLLFNIDLSFKEGKLEDFEDKIKSEIVKFIYNYKHKEPFVESRLVDHLHNEISEINRVLLPIGMKYRFLDPVELDYKESEFNDYLITENIPDIGDMITSNTTEFYTHEDLITCTEVDYEKFIDSGYLRQKYVD